MSQAFSALVIVGLLGMLGLFLTLSYLADRERPLRILVFLALAGVDLLAVPVGAVYAALPRLMAVSSLPAGMEDLGVGSDLFAQLPLFGALVMVTGLVGLTMLLPPARRALAHVLPIEPDRVVHVTALHYALYLIAMSLAVPIFISGMGDQAADVLAEGSAGTGLGLLWAQAMGFILVAFLGVGLFVARDGHGALQRLGLTARFSWRWWLVGTLIAIGSSLVVDAIWSATASESMQEVERLSEALFKPYLEAGLLGALTIGLSAGIGEEILFRGAAQPRLGLVFTSLLFAVVHTQYTISPALAQIFVVGLLLGLTRRQVNTTTAIGVHATYNLILALIMIYAPDAGV